LTRSLCVFEVSGQRFGIDTSRVREVVQIGRLTPVPRAVDEVMGLLNLRGLIVLAVDATRRLGLPEVGSATPEPAGGRRLAVVVTSAEAPVALLVDQVYEVLEVDERLFVPSEEAQDAPASDLLQGVYRTEEHLTLVLDASRVATSRCGTASVDHVPTVTGPG